MEGAVWNIFLNIPIKNFDIAVYGILLLQLEQILQNFGMVNIIGKLFNILYYYHLDINLSLPHANNSKRKLWVIFDKYILFEHYI